MKFIVFLALIVALGIIQPGYDPLADYESVLHKPYDADSPNRSLHHLACRNDTPEHVQTLLEKIADKKGVVLYFHGGLSDQKYMHTELGPWLEESYFSRIEFADFYPVFMNYDAHPLKENNWQELMGRYITLTAFKEAVGLFMRLINGEPGVAEQPAESLRARMLLQQAMGKQNIAPMEEDVFAEGEFEEYIEILEQRDKQIEFSQNLMSVTSFAASSAQIESTVTTMEQEDTEGVVNKSAILSVKAATVIVRSLVRLAIGTDHGVIATFEEEFFKELSVARVLNLQRFATAHWAMVKGNAYECVHNDTGKTFIEGLYAIKEAKGEDSFSINTLSHSAGAITTARLVEDMENQQRKLDNVVMMVPAVNQKDFTNQLIKHKEGYKNLHLYVLDEEHERADHVIRLGRVGGKPIPLYTASLLYFVSGGADNTWYNDSLLLLGQHLNPSRGPYNNGLYRFATKIKPDPVWKFMKDEESRVNLTYLPDGLPGGSETQWPRGPSHECTKYPWTNNAMGKAVMKAITGYEPGVAKFAVPDNFKAIQRNCING